MQIVNLKVSELKPYEKNHRTHPKKQIDLLAKNIERFGFTTPVLIDNNNEIIAGHGRLLALKQLGKDEVPCVRMENLSEEEVKALRLADNQIALMGDTDMKLVIEELKGLSSEMLDLTGFDKDLIINGKYDNYALGSVAEKYVIPPFSILDTRSGLWQNRKKLWLSLGIKSEEGRSEDLMGKGMRVLSEKQNTTYQSGIVLTGTSIFDPVLAEICYKWFCPIGGGIIDPFCGGSVRGIVASKLGYKYVGTELRKEQVDANIFNGKDILKDTEIFPNWICDDALNIKKHITNSQDMLFTCPPYGDLEVYSDNINDISNMEYDKFLKVYADILKESCHLLMENRFAVIVLGEIRNKEGSYRNFISDTIRIFQDIGLHFYNEMILINMIGTLPLRINKQFLSGRKIGKTHQNILVFWKGDLKKIKETVSQWKVEIDENWQNSNELVIPS